MQVGDAFGSNTRTVIHLEQWAMGWTGSYGAAGGRQFARVSDDRMAPPVSCICLSNRVFYQNRFKPQHLNRLSQGGIVKGHQGVYLNHVCLTKRRNLGKGIRL